MTDWQPIETAPKDGRMIMVSNGIAFGPAVKISDGSFHAWNNFFQRHDGKFWSGPNNIAATHWMPLPTPPAETDDPSQQPSATGEPE